MEGPKYYLTDYESGHSWEVSKEQYDNYNLMVECMRNNFNSNTEGYKGKVLVFGTGGEIDNNCNFKDLWYKNSIL